MRYRLASALLFAASTFCSHAAMAAIINLSAQLTPAQEVPAVQSNGQGQLVATLDTTSSELRWKVTYTGLTGPATMGHFHGPAGKGENAGVAIGFKGNLDSPITGEATLTAAQMGELMDGKWYVNIHTAQNPKGEIRGQVIPK